MEQALASIHYDRRGQIPAAPPLSGRPGVRCEHFSFERVGLTGDARVPLEGGRPRIVACIQGAGELVDTGVEPLGLEIGQTCLLPACRSAQLAAADGGVFLVIRV